MEICSGCGLCVKACPTKAIRIRDGKSFRMVTHCIGCMECVLTCPTGAVESRLIETHLTDRNRINIAIVTPVLYVQFPGTMPDYVLEALRRFGFSEIFDLQEYFRMYQRAVVEFIIRNRKKQEYPWPIISPVCPVVNQLIAVRFPSLLSHILPFKDPVVMMAEAVRKDTARKHGVPEKQVNVYYITACPAKITDDDQFDLNIDFPINGIIGINAIYSDLLGLIAEIKKENSPFPNQEKNTPPTNARSIMWGMSGGEIAGCRLEKSMAVTGLKEITKYIEKLEMGLFRNMEYIELRTCLEGCIGSTLTGIDKYIAKSAVHKMLRVYHGIGESLPREAIIERYDQGWFFSESLIKQLESLVRKEEAPLSIDALKKIDNLIELISGCDCAACGSPDCRTFAEDVIRGDVDLDKCLMIKARKATAKKKTTK
jgi:Fe-S-cluster-containing hydrogenase component 2